MLVPALWGCASAAPATRQDGREPWQTDWRAFGEAIAPYGRSGVIERRPGSDRGGVDFNARFAKEVEWTGTVASVHDNTVAVNIVIDMPPLEVPLTDGRSATLRSLSFQCVKREGRGCEGWTPELVGRRVRFRTGLANRTRGIQPVVRTTHGGGVRIETDGGELVRVERR